ncbi:MAG: hypothetical protein C4562_03605 [Actinobacteria bacterium]|nr:MAG: hypothetical protein C4562_03605 [Actinomycetota bacterium]
MAKDRSFTTDDIAQMRGTFFNPVNEVIMIVDDENYIDMSNFDLDNYSGDEWFKVSEDPLVDTTAVQEVLQLWETEGGVETTSELSETAEDQQS